jgi:hypothetical protein
VEDPTENNLLMPSMQIKSPYLFAPCCKSISLLIFFILLIASPSFADEFPSVSGKLDLRGVEAMENDIVKEDPSLTGQFKLDTNDPTWRFHSWLEGGWDGSVKRPTQNKTVFKNYDQVYQSNTPYLEFKELYGTYSADNLDLRAGIQRFAWGRLDEYPPNDLLNPWDYTQFLRKTLEDRKIGVPSVSASVHSGEWTYETVWVPVFVPYRLPLPDERWAGASLASTISRSIPNAEITPQEPDLPDRTLEHGNVAMRIKQSGDLEWALDLFHGYDPRPMFKTTALTIMPQAGSITIDPGYVPDFHRITVVGADAAAVRGDLSFRAEAAYTFNRYLDIRRELWGYPAVPAPGIYPLNPIEQKHDVLEYGFGADYRLFEDGLLTFQAQQTWIFGNVDLLYERKVETIIWANLKAGFMNQKIETNVNVAYNPEHGDRMSKANAWYVFSDAWKAGVTYVGFTGPQQSFFGRFSRNDQAEAELVYSW